MTRVCDIPPVVQYAVGCNQDPRWGVVNAVACISRRFGPSAGGTASCGQGNRLGRPVRPSPGRTVNPIVVTATFPQDLSCQSVGGSLRPQLGWPTSFLRRLRCPWALLGQHTNYNVNAREWSRLRATEFRLDGWRFVLLPEQRIWVNDMAEIELNSQTIDSTEVVGVRDTT